MLVPHVLLIFSLVVGVFVCVCVHCVHMKALVFCGRPSEKVHRFTL